MRVSQGFTPEGCTSRRVPGWVFRVRCLPRVVPHCPAGVVPRILRDSRMTVHRRSHPVGVPLGFSRGVVRWGRSPVDGPSRLLPGWDTLVVTPVGLHRWVPPGGSTVWVPQGGFPEVGPPELVPRTGSPSVGPSGVSPSGIPSVSRSVFRVCIPHRVSQNVSSGGCPPGVPPSGVPVVGSSGESQGGFSGNGPVLGVSWGVPEGGSTVCGPEGGVPVYGSLVVFSGMVPGWGSLWGFPRGGASAGSPGGDTPGGPAVRISRGGLRCNSARVFRWVRFSGWVSREVSPGGVPRGGPSSDVPHEVSPGVFPPEVSPMGPPWWPPGDVHLWGPRVCSPG
jgi:hypothetical protein